MAPTARVVVIPFPPLRANQTLRLRIAETYTAPLSYRLDEDELVFDRSLADHEMPSCCRRVGTARSARLRRL